MKIAVIGSGISGASAAWALSKTHDVTLYEKRERLGGHSATVNVDYDGKQIPVDTGFIVYNHVNYPNLTNLFEHLDVETNASRMAFSVSLDNGTLEWCGGSSLMGVFAQPSNLLSVGFLRMLSEIFRFNRRAHRDLNCGALCGLSLDDYLLKAGFSKRLKEHYLVPMASAIWSTPTQKMLEFPAENLIQFMKNHHLIQSKRPKWRTVTGGSKQYVNKLASDSDAIMRLSCEVTNVRRTGQGIIVSDATGDRQLYDQVVLAGHSDQSLKMLDTPSQAESYILSRIRYTPNDVWLHRDPALMPKRKNAWAAWNYMGQTNAGTDQDVSVTYWMNALQNIREDCPLFVTLNPLKKPDPSLTFARFSYSHPLFDTPAVEAQEQLETIQGKGGIWYCGAWTGFGFHEDGLSSGLEVARRLGGVIPWEANEPMAQAAE